MQCEKNDVNSQSALTSETSRILAIPQQRVCCCQFKTPINLLFDQVDKLTILRSTTTYYLSGTLTIAPLLTSQYTTMDTT
nr:hypothetical protein HmN_000751800 [Hymenolepis microstoma]